MDAVLIAGKLMNALATIRGSQRVTDREPEGKFQALDKYCVDLTAAAQAGKMVLCEKPLAMSVAEAAEAIKRLSSPEGSYDLFKVNLKQGIRSGEIAPACKMEPD